MSTELAMDFGQKYGKEYGDVVEKWAKRLKGVTQVSAEMQDEWGADLRKSLEVQIVDTLVDQIAPEWKKVGPLPSDETVKRFAQTAAKASLQQDMGDLLVRLRAMAQEEEPEMITAAMLVSTALKRVFPAVAQIFDMVGDRFGGIIEKYFQRKKALTGRRRWRVASLGSRHRRLDGEVRGEGENFEYKGQSIYGPRPPGGSPENWSNCSCLILYQRSDGSWTETR